MQWTKEQNQAILCKNKNILVSAAAGSGKTAVLVERIINMITDENSSTSIDRLLIVTFTNAAATEMKERIGKALANIIKKTGGSNKVQQQYLLLQKAKITTIHSFCNEVVRENFQMLNIDPNFQIGEETEIQLLKNEAVDELLEEKYSQKDTLFVNLSNVIGNGRDHTHITQIILDTYEFIQSFPWPFNWMNEKLKLLLNKDSFEKTLWGNTIIQYGKREINGAYKELLLAKQTAIQSDIKQYEESLENDLLLLSYLKENLLKDWDSIVKAFATSNFVNLKPVRNKEVDEEKEYIKSIRNVVKKKIEKLKVSYFNRISQEISNDLNQMHPYINTLSMLVEEFTNIYTNKKLNRNLLDFNDLEHYCLKVLVHNNEGKIVPTDAAAEYTQQFDEIFVDEYQDSNKVQEVILSTICGQTEGAPSRFMVGDVKQSIYKFRQAEPQIFMEKYDTFSDNEQIDDYRILLNKNFRSSKEIIDGVNYIFKQIMNKETAEVDYTKKEELVCGSGYETNTSNKFKIINLSDKETYDSEGAEDFESSQCEGKQIALIINELVNERGYEYKDIVILLRSMSGFVEDYLEELAKENIPAYADMGEGFLKTTEIQIIISLLNIIDNPRQDIPLVAVMRSNIFGFTPDELIQIRQHDGDSMYNALVNYPESEDDLWIKCKEFLNSLNNWRQKAFQLPIDELIYYLFTQTGYFNFVGTLPNGRQRQANLNMLFEKARAFEKTTYKGLFNFINYIDNLKSGKYDMGSATILGENDNVVRIMTIHKSKGLEFPVVIVGGLGKKFNYTDCNKKILLHREYGFGPDYFDAENPITYPTTAKKAIVLNIMKETAAEEMRILYVALTRPKEELYLIGTVKDLDKKISRWAQVFFDNGDNIASDLVLSCDNYLDWIGMSLIRHAQGKILRQLISNSFLKNMNIVDDDSKWELEIIDFGSIINIQSNKECDKDICTDEFLHHLINDKNSDYEETIKKKLEWKYEHDKVNAIPKKVSVTEIKRLYNILEGNTSHIFEEETLKRPSFMKEEKGLTPAERGTAIHTFIQHINFEEIKSNDDVQNYKETLLSKNILSESQIKSIDSAKIVNLIESEIGQRIKNALNVYKEVPFTIILDSNEVFDLVNTEEILIQGIIDCYFEEEDGIVLVDYKTDYILNNYESAVKDKYTVQMKYYSKAVEKITNKKVKEIYIYLFNNSKLIKI